MVKDNMQDKFNVKKNHSGADLSCFNIRINKWLDKKGVKNKYILVGGLTIIFIICLKVRLKL